MTTVTAPSAWDPASEARLIAALLAIAGNRLGGTIVVGSAGEVVHAWLALLCGLRSDHSKAMYVPIGTRREQLDDSLDLAATLSSGRRVVQRGLIDRASGQPLVLLGVDRWTESAAAHLFSVYDQRPQSNVGALFVAVEDGAADEAKAPKLLSERLAFRMSIEGLVADQVCMPIDWVERVTSARRNYPSVTCPQAVASSIVATAAALGIASSRADLMAVTVACAHAAWCQRDTVSDGDAEVAARLVLAPRARCVPADNAGPEETARDEQENTTGQSASERKQDDAGDVETSDGDLQERLVEAAAAALPPDLLAKLGAATGRMQADSHYTRRSSRPAKRARHGRPIGTACGDPRHDGPLNLLATIERAAPWQSFRRKVLVSSPTAPLAHRRVIVMPSDIRVTRFKNVSPSLAIFAVDASGSSAMHRMSEAKGAVELLLSECYVRREKVALVAFRGARAEVLLSPTFALARARRALSSLPGGGATPLASGIETARTLAAAGRAGGQVSLLVMLTDGRANIDACGVANRDRAIDDAMAAARRVALDGTAAIWIDTSAALSGKSASLAKAMVARYVPLPNAGAREIASAVRSSRPVPS